LPAHVATISRSISGKTHLLERILSTIVAEKKIDCLIIMSDTVGYNDDYQKILIPMAKKMLKKFYFGAWNKAFFEKYVATQKALPKEKRLRTIILLDDIVPVLNTDDLKYLSKIITTIRHFNISMFLSVQKANTTFTPSLRQNMHYVLFSKVNGDNMEVLADTINVPQEVIEKYVATLGEYEFGLYHNNGAKDYTFKRIKAVEKKE